METPSEKILKRTTLGPEEWDHGRSRLEERERCHVA
jgi:hypothetical protein